MDGLTNEQLVYIYTTNKLSTDSVEKSVRERKLTHEARTPIGFMVSYKLLTDEEAEEMLREPRYVLARSIVDTLGPVVELILEVQDFSYIDKLFGKVKTKLGIDPEEKEDL